MKKTVLLLLILTLFVFSCSNEPLEDSKKYAPAVLQESHVITYNADNNTTSVESMIKTGSGENYSTGELNGGKYVMLTSPASLMVNNEPMVLDSGRFVGSAYTWSKAGFVKEVEISYTNQMDEKFSYKASVNSIDLKDNNLEVYKSSDSYYLKWIGEPIGENEEISYYIEYKETDSKGKTKIKNFRIDNDREGEDKINISQPDLDKLLNNDRIEIYAERVKHIKSNSSSNPCIVIYEYRSAKRYLKTKKNLIDMILQL